MYLIPAKVGSKLCTGPHITPKNAEFAANVNGLDITSSILHFEWIGGFELGG